MLELPVLHMHKWNNFFPLLVWTNRIVFKIMNEVYNLIDLGKFVNCYHEVILYEFQKSYEIY